MGKKKGLMNDISVEEMLQMRNDEGLSNYEIAMRLGVTPNTVRYYIGTQPKANRTLRSFRGGRDEQTAIS